MTTPAQYQHQLSELQLDESPTEGLTPAQAQEKLALLLETEKKLQEIERAINLDIQVVRSRYHARAAATMAGSSSRVLESNKHRVGSQARAEETEKLNAERDSKLTPLEEVKKQADEMLAKLAVTRQGLEKQIQAS